MRNIVFFVCLSLFPFALSAQKISYNIPDGYAADINKDDYRIIVDAAVATVAKRYKIDFVKSGEIHLKKQQEMQIFNLHNLIDKCLKVADRNKWSIVVDEHFQNMSSSFDEQKKINPSDFESIKKYLSLRIYPSTFAAQNGGITGLVVRTDIPETSTILMLDLPGAFAPVPRAVFAGWNQDSSTVFGIAQNNINQQKIEKQTREFDFDGTKVEINFLGNEDYAASYLLDLLNNSPEFVGDWGSVIAVPNKGLVDICKISRQQPVEFVKFIQNVKPLNDKSYKEHPQRISDQFFWYYKGKFTKINIITNADGGLSVVAPMGLAELMSKPN